ncbi:PREDICTED: craniofacial development protein 2-like [Nicotiana attenuata]|uniref:craniofacial development protein 2-like n=1 Tax=Nicotiana attenuata TaxID=49451 RepID=UPI000904930D|nr:PREDICTED: craniofacial development protein 2-like [Nicotiana attenuata]
MQQILGRTSALKGQLRRKDEEIEAVKRAAAECERRGKAKAAEAAADSSKKEDQNSVFQETKWKGTKARDVNGYNLWYSGDAGGKNGVGILVDMELRELVVEVRRVSYRVMEVKLVVGGLNFNVISAYAPQIGLGEKVKRQFWEDLDEVVRGIPCTEMIFIGGDFNGHIGANVGGYDDVHGGFSFGDRNEAGTLPLDFARAFDLVVVNSSFPKREEHLITFRSTMARTQIDS